MFSFWAFAYIMNLRIFKICIKLSFGWIIMFNIEKNLSVIYILVVFNQLILIVSFLSLSWIFYYSEGPALFLSDPYSYFVMPLCGVVVLSVTYFELYAVSLFMVTLLGLVGFNYFVVDALQIFWFYPLYVFSIVLSSIWY